MQCRTCLKVSRKITQDIFSENLSFKLMEIASVEILKDESLPTKICNECARNVHLLYDFRNIVRRSDEVLREQNSQFASSHTESKFQNEEVLNVLTSEVNIKEEFQDDTLPTLDALFSDEVDTKETVENDFVDSVLTVVSPQGEGVNLEKEESHYKCKMCDFTCSVKSLYQSHYKSHKRKLVKMCSICGKSVQHENFSRHMTIHDEATVSCKVCGKIAKNVNSLRSHMYSHGAPLQCNICGKTYKHPQYFYTHRKRHRLGDKKTVKCEICEKLFYDKRMLPKHMRTHTGERPYPCEYCKKGFSSSYALKTHQRQHTNEKPFACEYCDLAFAQRVSLKTHLKSKHPDK